MSGNDIISQGLADAVSFGAPFIANPDLVARFTYGDPLADADRATIYAGSADGYTDYPTAADVTRRRAAPSNGRTGGRHPEPT